MNIADARRHRSDGTGIEALRCALFDQIAMRRGTVMLRNFRATQHADQPPNRMIVHGRRLPRPQTKLTIEKRCRESACNRNCW